MSLSPHPELLGAVFVEGVARFRVWAPAARRVDVVFEDGNYKPLPLASEAGGYFSGATQTSARLYKYRVDDTGPWPDPCSRFQPQGVHGPSMLVEPDAFHWTDTQWRGIDIERQVIYELHIGTFTPEGTFDAVAAKLEHLRDVGVTVLEIMPVAECPGRWNWGYDGVQIYAPYHVYGDHESLKRFVDRAHALSLAVITFLDSKLDWSERERNSATLNLHRDLLRLRASDAVISRQDVTAIDGATLSEHSLVLRWFDADHGDRLLIVNLDAGLPPGSIAEPLLAPSRGSGWQVLWHSEAPEYGGLGSFEPVADHGRGAWRIQAQCAVLLVAAPRIVIPEVRA